jgi:hypothetical protein
MAFSHSKDRNPSISSIRKIKKDVTESLSRPSMCTTLESGVPRLQAGWLRVSMHPLTVSVSGEATFELMGATTSSG